jgi:predicted phage gp36 major capsid-like protein
MEDRLMQKAVGPVAVAAVGVATAFAVLGTYGETGDHGARDLLIVLAIVAIGAAAVFGYVVPRGLGREAAGASALVLSVLGLLTVAVFWSGLPPILAAGGILLGWAGRNAERGRMTCRAAIAIGTLAIAADVAIVLGDWLSNR